MKFSHFSNCIIFALICFSTVTAQSSNKQTGSSIPAHPSKLKFQALDWTVPLGSPYRTELKNGLITYIAEDNTLPLVQVVLYIRSGSLLDPSGKEGLASLMANLMRVGGTSKYPADTLNELIDQYAMKFEISATEAQISFSASFLSEYTDKAMDIMEQLIFHPVFSAKKFEKEQKIMIQNIRHRFDDPAPTLRAAYQKQLYAGEVSYRLATEASVKNISRDDLIKLHKKTFVTPKMILSVAGNFNRDSMLAKVEKIFPPSTQVPNDSFPQIAINPKIKCLLVQKPLSQAYVRLGLPLFKRPHPDYYSVSLLNEILGGGGFISRLGTKIRSDAGLTYSIYSNAESNYTYPGTFYIEFFTKNSSFSQAVAMIIEEVQKVISEQVTDQELENAKASLTGSLPSMFRSPFDIVSTYAWNEYYKRDPDHFKVYEEKLKKVTREEVLRVAKQYLIPDNFTYTIVGDTDALLNQETNGFSLSKMAVKTIPADSIAALP
jgi:zinc protease